MTHRHVPLRIELHGRFDARFILWSWPLGDNARVSFSQRVSNEAKLYALLEVSGYSSGWIPADKSAHHWVYDAGKMRGLAPDLLGRASGATETFISEIYGATHE